MTLTSTDFALANTVALRLDGPEGNCPAWMEAADRRCGKPATEGLLCARHHKVALVRYEKVLAANAKWVERRKAKGAERLPKAEAELAEVERRYAGLEPTASGPAADPAMVNMPLSKRIPSDTRIAELARLVRQRENLVSEIAGLRSILEPA
jgi:hypothetical protein